MAALEGFSYEALRNMPHDELARVRDEAARIAKIRADSMRRKR